MARVRLSVAERREELLRAAVEQIEARGVAAVRIADVASALGVSNALVLYHFSSKEQLVAAAFASAAGPALAKTSDIPVGGGTVFADRKVVVTQPKAGEFKAFSAVCTHQGCLVNKVADGTIDCPCHGSKYAIADAAVVAGPAPRPLPAERITVSGDSITLG